MEKDEIIRSLNEARKEAAIEEHAFFEANKDQYLSAEDIEFAREMAERQLA